MCICRYCNQKKKLCKAHIIPKAFITDMKNHKKEEYCLILKKELKKSPKTTRTGVFDENILCKECDGEFGIYDNYAQKFLLKTNLEKYKLSEKAHNYYELPSDVFHYEYIKKFFISLLYRASLSQKIEFKYLNMGPKLENMAKEYLKGNIKDSVFDFSILLFKLNSEYFEEQVSKFLIQPLLRRIDGVNCYTMILGGYKILIKADNRKFSKVINRLIMTKDKLYIPEIDFDSSKDMKHMQDLAVIKLIEEAKSL